MPTELRNRIRTPYTPDLDLPPAFRVVSLREAGNAFEHACKIARKEGAGTLVWAPPASSPATRAGSSEPASAGAQSSV